MKILVIGSGGREHALIWKIRQNPRVTEVYAAPGNGGIAEMAQCVDIKATDMEAMTAFAVEKAIDLVVVAPDDPLALGMVDAMEAAGVRAFGPNKAAAVIEGSKAFSKELMRKYGIPTADYHTFDDFGAAAEFIAGNDKYPVVIKADGLALGKGVLICEDETAAQKALQDMMQDKVFGGAGSKVVIEEFLTGPEVSVLAFTDGKTMIPMVSAQDHKRALDGDQGLNTGGMGAFSPSRHYTDDVAAVCMKTIFLPTMNAMNAEGRKFKGVLYFGLMLTVEGPKVIEYNCRFGDPEAQAVLMRLETDIVDIMEAVIDERLAGINIQWKNEAAACVVMASGGYPGKYDAGEVIDGLGAANALPDTMVFHAGTKLHAGQTLTAGGRVLGVTALGKTLDAAIENAYSAVKRISFNRAHYRTDIGKK